LVGWGRKSGKGGGGRRKEKGGRRKEEGGRRKGNARRAGIPITDHPPRP